MLNLVRSVICCLLLAGPGQQAAAAGGDCDRNNPACVQIGQWNFSVALGLGTRTNPVEGGDNIPLIAVPQFSYYGERFFIDNLDLGYTLFEDTRHSLNLIASPGYDRVFFQRSDLQNFFVDSARATLGTDFDEVPSEESPDDGLLVPPELATLRERERRVTYLGGFEWSYGFDGAQLQLNYLQELTREHHGDEVRLALAFPLYSRDWQLAATLGATWKSAQVVSYYYGEDQLYEPGSAVNPFARVSYSRPLNQQWTLKIFGHYQKLGTSIADSPIVEEDNVLTVFVGGVYSF